MHKMLISTMLAGAAFVAVPASAAITVDTTSLGVTLNFNPFNQAPSPTENVHIVNEQTGIPEITANTSAQGTGTGFLFTSTAQYPLTALVSGQGLATVTGPFQTLTFSAADPLDAFSLFEFNLDVDAGAPFYTDITANLLGGGSVRFEDVLLDGNGQNKFRIYGDTFESIVFSAVSGTINDITQVRVTAVPGAVPEPATWAMMLLGFGIVGGAMRRRRKVGVSYQMA